MTDGNGTDPAVPILAGHLVIYPDMIAFRPDDGADEEVIYRRVQGNIGGGAIGAFLELLSPGDGGQLGRFLMSDIGSLNPMAMMKAAGANRQMRRAAASAAREAGAEIDG